MIIVAEQQTSSRRGRGNRKGRKTLMPVFTRPLGVFVIAILMATMTIAAAAETPPPTPSFPATIDNYAKNAPWVCDPTVKPGTKAFAELLKSTYGYGYTGLTRSCGATTGAGRSYHKMGLAVDWSVTVYDAANRNAGNRADRMAAGDR